MFFHDAGKLPRYTELLAASLVSQPVNDQHAGYFHCADAYFYSY